MSEYLEELNEAAGRAMGWVHGSESLGPGHNQEVWHTPDGGMISDWGPAHIDEHLGMLLGRVMDSNQRVHVDVLYDLLGSKATVFSADHDRGVNDWRSTAYDKSWRVALIKALIVVRGGRLPEEESRT